MHSACQRRGRRATTDVRGRRAIGAMRCVRKLMNGLVGYRSKASGCCREPRPTALGVLKRLPSRISETVSNCILG